MQVKQFCFCFDLRRGCVTYAWLQMMLMIILIFELKWLSEILIIFQQIFLLFAQLSVGLVIAIQIIKGSTCILLIFGIIKKYHLFYQPWLFINALENAALLLLALGAFVGGCFEPIGFYFVIPYFTFSVFGWYIWSCVYTVYKKDVKPDLIKFEPVFENINNHLEEENEADETERFSV